MNRYVWLVAASAIATFILIVVGGIVRITGSGLGCPDWPLCHGQVVPPFRVDALIEFSHRFIAATMTTISGVALFFAWFPKRRPAAPWLTAAALTLIVQIGIGAVVVLLETLPIAVNVHLMFAMTIFGLILVALVQELPARFRPVAIDPGLQRLSFWSVVGTFLLLVSGSYVYGSGSTLGCNGWPLCDTIIPLTFVDIINFIHRFVAGAIGVLVLWTAYHAWRARAANPVIGGIGVTIAALFVIQIVVGALIVLTRLNGPWPAFHLAFAAAVWANVVGLAALARVTAPASVPSAAPERARATVSAQRRLA